MLAVWLGTARGKHREQPLQVLTQKNVGTRHEGLSVTAVPGAGPLLGVPQN